MPIFQFFSIPVSTVRFQDMDSHQKKVTRPRPYDQHGEDISILCTLDSKIVFAEGILCGVYDRAVTNIHDGKVLQNEAILHIFSNQFFCHTFFTDCNLQLIFPESTASTKGPASETAQLHPNDIDSFHHWYLMVPQQTFLTILSP